MVKREIQQDTVQLTFVLPQETPGGRVSVVGDFNEWTPGVHTLVKRSNGTRSVRVPVQRGGSYRFRYLAEGGVWFDDPAVALREEQDGVVHPDGTGPPDGVSGPRARRGRRRRRSLPGDRAAAARRR